MKQSLLVALLCIFTVSAVAAPTTTFAKKGGDDDRERYEYRSDDDEDDEEDDDDWEDDRDEDDWDEDWSDSDDDRDEDELEIEADIFTDMTIVKVELRNGKKTTFSTGADTRSEVVDAVAARFDLSRADIDAVLELEFEDRASRAKERAKISNHSNNWVDRCDNASSTLEVEADVFTDTTIVKVELKNGTKHVFETDVTSTDDIVDEVAERYTSLTKDEIRNALDRDVEDRKSRASDFRISSNNRDCDDEEEDIRDERVNDRLKELQRLIETLIRILNERA